MSSDELYEPEILPDEDPGDYFFKLGWDMAKKEFISRLSDGSDCGQWAIDVIEGRA